MAKNDWLRISLMCAATAMVASAQTFTALASFQNEAYPEYVSLIEANDGNFYGTTLLGGLGVGTVFEGTPAGSLTDLADFSDTDDGYPYAGVVQAADDGTFYGTTWQRGVHNAGTLYEVVPSGTVNVFYSFCSLTNCADGGEPFAPLVLANDGNFYGATSIGGAKGYGMVFAATSSGSLTTLHSFRFKDGSTPVGGLIQANDGNFYGTTLYGGSKGGGVVFRISAAGKFKMLYSFCSQKKCVDGANPYTGLVQAKDGTFYGTTFAGGAHGHGTVFRITNGGTLTTLYSFCSQKKCADGADSIAGVIQATDGDFYGTTSKGGANNWGTIFQITSSGALTTLHSFCMKKNCTDGAEPSGGMLQATSGIFYGTTTYGGEYEQGTFYSLSLGLVPTTGIGDR